VEVLVRRVWAAASLAAVLGACGGGTLTLSEYAAEAEALVAAMEARFEALDAEWESQTPTRDGALAYWDGRLDIRTDFLDGVRALRPPEAVADQHDAALDIFTRITEADEALAARVATFDTVTEHWEWVDTPEGRAAEAVLEEVWAFCRSSQAEYDATETGEALEDQPWVPGEMTEVVKVAFGCPP
jgi:hypothetical protein